MQQPSQTIEIKTLTWLKYSSSLFDYDKNKSTVSDQKVLPLRPSYVFFYRNHEKSEIVFQQKDEMVPEIIEGCRLLGCFKIINHQGKYRLLFYHSEKFEMAASPCDRLINELSSDSDQEKNQRTGLIVRSLKANDQEARGYALKTGQRVKFGRVQYSIKVCSNDDRLNDNTQDYFDDDTEVKVDSGKIFGSQTQCKLCLSSEQYEPYLFFCQPCNCSGSMSVIHYQCLAQWCQTKVKKNVSGNLTSYNLRKFSCEICKKTLPRFISRNGEKHDLMPIQRPAGPHLLMKEISPDSGEVRLLTIIKYDEGKIVNIGRSLECELRLDDISVSRKHAKIESRDGQFLIYDRRSKFGTLVEEQNLCLELDQTKRGVQIGRSILIFKLSEPPGKDTFE